MLAWHVMSLTLVTSKIVHQLCSGVLGRMKIEFVQRKGILSCCSTILKRDEGAARGGAAPVLGEEKYIQVNAEYKEKNENRI